MTTRLPWSKRLALRLPIPKAREARSQLTAPAPQAMQWADLASAALLDESHPRPTQDDVALLLYTSGTTGVQKGVPLLHSNLVANVLQGRAWVSGLEEGTETFLVALPLFHAYGVTVSVLLGVALAFVAGAINAGGFLAVREYTSHMTGIVSSAADHLVLGDSDLVLAALGALLSFLLGAACTAILVNYIRRRGLHSGFALPLLLEAVLLLVFGILGARLAG